MLKTGARRKPSASTYGSTNNQDQNMKLNETVDPLNRVAENDNI